MPNKAASSVAWNGLAQIFAAPIAWCHQRPLFVMGVCAMIKGCVPAVAKIAGNIDFHRHERSHMFGYGAICVAVDFPGWREVSSILWFFSGLVDAWVVVTVCGRVQQQGAQVSRVGLIMLQVFLMTCFSLFWTTGLEPLFNKNQNMNHMDHMDMNMGHEMNNMGGMDMGHMEHSGLGLVVHHAPFILMRYGYVVWVIFLAIKLPPDSFGRRLKVFWNCCACTFVVVCFAFTSFAATTVMFDGSRGPNHQMGEQGPEVGTPYVKYILPTLENWMYPPFFFVLFVHPLGLMVPNSYGAIEDVDKVHAVEEGCGGSKMGSYPEVVVIGA